MTDQQAVGIFGLLVAMGAAMIVCALIWYVLQVIARWKIFTKAGEAGWKSIIPIYNDYVIYKVTWNTKYFWIMFGLVILYSIFSGIAANVQGISTFMYILAFVAIVAACVIEIMQLHKLSKAFGHGAGFTVGLVLLNPIFMLILGFGSSEYKGIQE